MQNEEIMIFELIAGSLIKELKDMILHNRLNYIVTPGSVKRSDILKDLFQVNNQKDLNKNLFDEVNLLYFLKALIFL
jgi:hypothetical protein